MVRPASFVPRIATAADATITSEPIMNVHQSPDTVVDASTHDE